MKRSRRVIEAFVSGCIVYALMAACSSSSMMAGSSGTGGMAHGTGGMAHGTGGMAHGTGGTAQGGHTGMGGMPGTGGMMGAGGDSGIMDALTDPVPNAEAGIENPQSGTRLKGKYTMGSDGSKEYELATTESSLISNALGVEVHSVWYDSMLMADCSYYAMPDGSTRCVPGHLGPVYFADNQCTQPLLAIGNVNFGCTPKPVPKFMMYYLPMINNGCPAKLPLLHVAQVGAMVTPGTVYSVSINGTSLICGPSGPGSGFTFYQATEMPPSAFVQGTSGIDP